MIRKNFLKKISWKVILNIQKENSNKIFLKSHQSQTFQSAYFARIYRGFFINSSARFNKISPFSSKILFWKFLRNIFSVFFFQDNFQEKCFLVWCFWLGLTRKIFYCVALWLNSFEFLKDFFFNSLSWKNLCRIFFFKDIMNILVFIFIFIFTLNCSFIKFFS